MDIENPAKAGFSIKSYYTNKVVLYEMPPSKQARSYKTIAYSKMAHPKGAGHFYTKIHLR